MNKNQITSALTALAGILSAKFGLQLDNETTAFITLGLSLFINHWLHAQSADKPKNGVLGLAVLAAPLLFCSCKNTQVVLNESGQGFKGTLAVPVGNGTVIGASMVMGSWKGTQVLQPTSTNTLRVPSLAVVSDTIGKASVNGGTGTNSQAAIVGGYKERYAVVTGDTVAQDDSSGTNQIIHLDGYQGTYVPRGQATLAAATNATAVTTNAPSK